MRIPFFVVITIVFLFGCSENVVLKRNTNNIVLQGKISNVTDSIIKFNFREINQKFTAKVDLGGNFYVKMDWNKPSVGALGYNGEYTKFFLAPGDSLFITIDTKHFDESIKYSGIGAEVNNYLAENYLFDEAVGNKYRVPLFKFEYSRFMSVLDSISMRKKDKYLTQISQNSVVSEYFKKREHHTIKYDYVSQIVKYPFAHSMYDSTYVAHEDYLDVLDDYDLYDTIYGKYGKGTELRWALVDFYLAEQKINLFDTTILSKKEEIVKEVFANNQDIQKSMLKELLVIREKIKD
jgi:hypothetical protein